MIDRANDGENAVDLIDAHSHLRFWCDSFGPEFYLCKFAKHDFKFVPITPDFNDDCEPARAMTRNIVVFFV